MLFPSARTDSTERDSTLSSLSTYSEGRGSLTKERKEFLRLRAKVAVCGGTYEESLKVGLISSSQRKAGGAVPDQEEELSPMPIDTKEIPSGGYDSGMSPTGAAVDIWSKITSLPLMIGFMVLPTHTCCPPAIVSCVGLCSILANATLLCLVIKWVTNTFLCLIGALARAFAMVLVAVLKLFAWLAFVLSTVAAIARLVVIVQRAFACHICDMGAFFAGAASHLPTNAVRAVRHFSDSIFEVGHILSNLSTVCLWLALRVCEHSSKIICEAYYVLRQHLTAKGQA